MFDLAMNIIGFLLAGLIGVALVSVLLSIPILIWSIIFDAEPKYLREYVKNWFARRRLREQDQDND